VLLGFVRTKAFSISASRKLKVIRLTHPITSLTAIAEHSFPNMKGHSIVRHNKTLLTVAAHLSAHDVRHHRRSTRTDRHHGQ
jgi:hypothetical protein